MNVRENLKTPEGDKVTTDKLMADLRVLAEDAERLLKATASRTGQQVATARTQAEDSLRAGKARVAHLQELALAKTRRAGRVTDGYVRANSWKIIAACIAGAVVVGFLLGSSRDAELDS